MTGFCLPPVLLRCLSLGLGSSFLLYGGEADVGVLGHEVVAVEQGQAGDERVNPQGARQTKPAQEDTYN